MSVTISTIIILTVISCIVLFFITKFYKKKYIKPEREIIFDPQSQKQYENANLAKDKKENLSLKERIELSWRFLNDIIKKIVNFSTDDKTIIEKSGIQLLKHGTDYQHDVNYELEARQKMAKNILSTRKPKNMNRSI